MPEAAASTDDDHHHHLNSSSQLSLRSQEQQPQPQSQPQSPQPQQLAQQLALSEDKTLERWWGGGNISTRQKYQSHHHHHHQSTATEKGAAVFRYQLQQQQQQQQQQPINLYIKQQQDPMQPSFYQQQHFSPTGYEDVLSPASSFSVSPESPSMMGYYEQPQYQQQQPQPSYARYRGPAPTTNQQQASGPRPAVQPFAGTSTSSFRPTTARPTLAHLQYTSNHHHLGPVASSQLSPLTVGQEALAGISSPLAMSSSSPLPLSPTGSSSSVVGGFGGSHNITGNAPSAGLSEAASPTSASSPVTTSAPTAAATTTTTTVIDNITYEESGPNRRAVLNFPPSPYYSTWLRPMPNIKTVQVTLHYTCILLLDREWRTLSKRMLQDLGRYSALQEYPGSSLQLSLDRQPTAAGKPDSMALYLHAPDKVADQFARLLAMIFQDNFTYSYCWKKNFKSQEEALASVELISLAASKLTPPITVCNVILKSRDSVHESDVFFTTLSKRDKDRIMEMVKQIRGSDPHFQQQQQQQQQQPQRIVAMTSSSPLPLSPSRPTSASSDYMSPTLTSSPFLPPLTTISLPTTASTSAATSLSSPLSATSPGIVNRGFNPLTESDLAFGSKIVSLVKMPLHELPESAVDAAVVVFTKSASTGQLEPRSVSSQQLFFQGGSMVLDQLSQSYGSRKWTLGQQADDSLIVTTAGASRSVQLVLMNIVMGSWNLQASSAPFTKMIQACLRECETRNVESVALSLSSFGDSTAFLAEALVNAIKDHFISCKKATTLSRVWVCESDDNCVNEISQAMEQTKDLFRSRIVSPTSPAASAAAGSDLALMMSGFSLSNGSSAATNAGQTSTGAASARFLSSNRRTIHVSSPSQTVPTAPIGSNRRTIHVSTPVTASSSSALPLSSSSSLPLAPVAILPPTSSSTTSAAPSDITGLSRYTSQLFAAGSPSSPSASPPVTSNSVWSYN